MGRSESTAIRGAIEGDSLSRERVTGTGPGTGIDGRACRGARAMLGLSQNELCVRAGVGRKLLNGFEAGGRLVRGRNVERIRTALEQAGARFQHFEDGSVAVRVVPGDALDRDVIA